MRLKSALVVFLTGHLSLSAAIFVVEPAADARVIGIIGGLSNSNYEKDILSVYSAPGNEQQTFIRFDFGEVTIPPGERLSSAVLSLQASTSWGTSGKRPMEVYQVIRPWTESKITWNSSDTGAPWVRPGGDYVGRYGGTQPFASLIADPNNGDIVAWDVTELVNLWLEGLAPNYGMLLRSSHGNGLTFVQRESSNAKARPVLRLETTAGPPLLRLDRDASGLILSWRGEGGITLEENSSASPSGWTISSRPKVPSNGRTAVALVTGATPAYFRLRAP